MTTLVLGARCMSGPGGRKGEWMLMVGAACLHGDSYKDGENDSAYRYLGNRMERDGIQES